MSADKTNVMRILDQKKIKYKVHEYKESGAVSGVEVAAALGQNPKRAFKTLVTVGKSGIIMYLWFLWQRSLTLRKRLSVWVKRILK